MNALSLGRNVSWAFTGNLASTLSQFGMLLILVHMGSPEMVGQYGLGLAVTAPIFLLVGMSLRNVHVTDMQQHHQFSEYAVVRLIGLIAGMAVVTIAVAGFGYTAETAAVIILLGLAKSLEGLSDVIYGAFQKHEKMDLIAKSMIVKAILTLTVFAAVLWGTDNLIVAIASISIVWLCRLLVYDVQNLLRIEGYTPGQEQLLYRSWSVLRRIREDHKRLLALLMLSLPMGLSSSLISLNVNIPRYVIELSGSTEQLGIFTVLAYPLVAGNTVMSALADSSLPRLARYHSGGSIEAFARLLVKMLILALGLAIVALALAASVGEPLLRVGFGAQYAAHESVFVVLVLGMAIGFLNWCLNSAIMAMRMYKELLVVQAIAASFTLAGSFLVIPSHGIIGAAWLLAGSALIQVLTKAIIVIMRVRPTVQMLARIHEGTA